MPARVVYYAWPSNQECLGCIHSKGVVDSKGGIICLSNILRDGKCYWFHKQKEVANERVCLPRFQDQGRSKEGFGSGGKDSSNGEHPVGERANRE